MLPPTAAMFFDGSKFREIFEKGHQRNNPHGGHVFRRIKVSRTVFEKGHQRQSCEIILKSDMRFHRRKILNNFSEIQTVKKASPMAAIFFDVSIFLEHFLKRVTQESFL